MKPKIPFKVGKQWQFKVEGAVDHSGLFNVEWPKNTNSYFHLSVLMGVVGTLLPFQWMDNILQVLVFFPNCG